MTIATAKDNELTPKSLNNFLVSMREGVRQARVHLIHHHTRRIKALAKEKSSAPTAHRNKATSTNSSTSTALPDVSTEPANTSLAGASHPLKNKNKQKALKLGKEIKAVKSFSDGDLGKLVLLNTKPFNQAAREKCSAGQRGVCRLAEHEALKKCKQQFGEMFGDSAKQLPYCIKVLGVSRRYKKLRKLDKRGKKEKFLENQRFCLRLLREIGGTDFASAEDLFRKMGKQKKKQSVTEKSEKSETGDGDNCDGDTDDDGDDEAAEESSSSDEEDTVQQKEVKNKIHQKLDALLGKWDDDESDSDLEVADVSSELTISKDTNASTKSILAKVPIPSKSSTKLGNVKSVCDIPRPTSDVSQPSTNKIEANDGLSKEIQQSSNLSAKAPIKITKTRLELKDKDPSLIAPSAFFASFASKQIDLEKVKATGVIPGGSKKRGRELNPEDELEELPRKIAERNKRRALKRTAAEAENSLQKEEDDDDKFDPTKFNIRFNAKKLGEALLQKDDIRKPTGLATRGSGGDSRRGSRGGALGNNRGGARGRGGGSRDGFAAGPRNTPTGSERGTQQRGSRGRGLHGGQSDGDRGRGGQRGSERGRGAGSNNSSGSRAESSQSNEYLHPSWAAKKQEKMGISGFQGKKITFD